MFLSPCSLLWRSGSKTLPLTMMDWCLRLGGRDALEDDALGVDP